MASVAESPVLLDTSVLSFLLKPNDSRANLYAPDIEGRLVTVSFVTIAEVYRWAYLRKWGPTRLSTLEERLRKLVQLPAHDAVARQWAQIQTIPGRPFPANDAWQAACALVYGCVLVTHDRHFLNIPGLRIITHLP